VAGIEGVLGKVGRAQLRHRALQLLALDTNGLAPFVLKNLLQGQRRVFFRVFAFSPFPLIGPVPVVAGAADSLPAQAGIK
jgi:hypothetical protein